MSFTHTIGVSYKTGSLSVANTTNTYTADGEVSYSGTVAASTTNQEVDVALTIANVKSLVLYADQALTIKTNSTSSPGATIVLAAKKEVVWTTDHLEANPFVTNVTKMYATNSGATVANLVFSAVTDITP